MTLEQALQELNAMFLPAVSEGDKAVHGGYEFIYQNGAWVPVSE